jgi:hypothetical protein
MKTILTSTSAASLIAMFAFAQSPSSITADRVTTTAAQHQVQASPNAGTTAAAGYGRASLRHAPPRPDDGRRSGRNLWVYVITGDFQFGLIDLANGAFLPIGSGLPPDAGAGLVPGPGTSLLTLGFSGNLYAIDPFTGSTSTVGATGLRDCSTGSADPLCPNVIGRHDGKVYATDFANNLYSVDSRTGAATLIGPTGMPPITFVPFSENSDGSVNVYTENLFSAHGKLYANFATVAVNFVTGTFRSIFSGSLYEIDPKTGRAAPIGGTDDNLTGIVNLNDTVYAFDVASGKVVTLDVTNGRTAPVSDLDPAAGVVVGATPARPSPGGPR